VFIRQGGGVVVCGLHQGLYTYNVYMYMYTIVYIGLCNI